MTSVKRFEFNVSRNEVWHVKHKLPQNSTLDKRIEFHIEHARICPCSMHDEDIIEELKKRYLGKHQDFWIEHSTNDHRALGLWSAECAERLLPYFEEKYEKDTRPRDAIKTLREWAKTGEFHMAVIRAAALSAHAAAKLVDKEDKAANYAAHVAGHAVGTAHVPTHAIGVVLYSIKLITYLHPENIKTYVAEEREWQDMHLPKNLKSWVDDWIERTFSLLPKSLREQLE